MEEDEELKRAMLSISTTTEQMCFSAACSAFFESTCFICLSAVSAPSLTTDQPQVQRDVHWCPVLKDNCGTCSGPMHEFNCFEHVFALFPSSLSF